MWVITWLNATWPSAFQKKNGNLMTVTCSSATIHLAKCMNWSLIQVMSKTVDILFKWALWCGKGPTSFSNMCKVFSPCSEGNFFPEWNSDCFHFHIWTPALSLHTRLGTPARCRYHGERGSFWGWSMVHGFQKRGCFLAFTLHGFWKNLQSTISRKKGGKNE